MAPVLISSATGKKAAPKGAIRRRPAAPGPAPSSQTTPSAATSVAPQSPPPTQAPVVEEPVQEENVEQTKSTPAPSEPVFEPEVQQTPQEPVVQPVTQAAPAPAAEPTRDATPALNEETRPAPAQAETQQEGGAIEREPEAPAPPAEPAQEPVVDPVAPELNVQNEEQQHESVEDSQPAQQTGQPAEAPAPPAPAKPATKRTRKDPPTSAPARPAKGAKRTSTRSNATVQAEAQGDEQAAATRARAAVENGDASATPATEQPQTQTRKKPTRKAPASQRKTRSKAKSAATIQNSDDEDEAAPSPESPEDEDGTEERRPKRRKRKQPEDEYGSEEPPPKKPKQRRKKKQVRIAQSTGADGEENGEQGQEGQEGQEEQGSDESDPELHEIDPNTLSMWDLSHETRYGKTSERGRKMAEIDWEEVAQKRREEAQAIADNQQPAPTGEVVQSVEGPDGTTESQPADGEQAQPSQTNGGINTGEAFLVDADGNIVLDEETVRHDATAQAMQAAETGAVEDVNDLTATINRTTWMNNNRRDPTDRVPLWKWKSDPWSEEETDRFYDALSMFGSDFFIISKMFPGKNRRMVKAKFNREERLDPKRVDDALTGKSTRAMDLEHYSRETGRDVSVFMKYDGIEHAQSIINESMKDKHEAMAAAAQQEAALAEEKAEREKTEKREKSRTAKKARQKRAKAGGTLGGGPDEASAG